MTRPDALEPEIGGTPLKSRLNPLLLLLAWCALATGWSAYRPADYATWIFELSVGLVWLAVLAATYRRFRFSGLVYLLVGIHFAILAVGAKYTYAEMPLFNWLKDALGLARNHYDRVGHFAQGFVPALVIREVVLRTTRLERGKMLFFLVVSACLAVSACYEFLEWWMVVVFYPTQGADWLGMQGDRWDAQQDMFMALVGAIVAMLTLQRLHDRSMRAVPVKSART